MSALTSGVNNLNVNKCPHGFPVGSCPICSGHGGMKTSSDKSKPRVKGEMSYNECMAVWRNMQYAKKVKENERRNEFLKIFNSFYEKLPKIKTLVSNLKDTLSNIFTTTPKNLLKVSLNFTLNLILSPFRALQNVIDKISLLVGEIKNSIKNNLEKIASTIKEKLSLGLKTLLELFCQNKKEEKDKDKKEKILNKILKFLLKENNGNNIAE